MFVTDYKLWPENSEADNQTKPKLLLLYLRALKFQAQSYMEIPLSNYSEKEIQEHIQELDKKRNTLNGYAMNEPERFWHFLHHLFDKHPELLAAYDIMGWDIWSQLYKTTYQKLIRLPDKKVYEYQPLQVAVHETDLNNKENDHYLFVDIPHLESLMAKGELKKRNVLLTITDLEEWKYVEALQHHEVKSLWVEPTLKILKALDDEQLKDIDGLLFNPIKLEGFTPLIDLLMAYRKKNIPVGIALKEGSIIGQTVYAQFAPVLQKLFITDTPYSLPATGIKFENDAIVFNQAPGMGLAFVENFW